MRPRRGRSEEFAHRVAVAREGPQPPHEPADPLDPFDGVAEEFGRVRSGFRELIGESAPHARIAQPLGEFLEAREVRAHEGERIVDFVRDPGGEHTEA